MKINQITYHDHELEWRLEPIEFSELTLLVGVSGVGKTQIIQSIMNLRKIAKGGSLNGVEWNIKFTAESNEYQWRGKFETKKVASLIVEDEKSNNNKFRIVNEILFQNDTLLVERSNSEIIFKGEKLPKLSPVQSVVDILSEEDIAPVNGFNKIIYSEQSIGSNSINEIYPILYLNLANQPYTLEKIQESNLPTQIKLALAYKHNLEIFNNIKERFIDIFVQVEDLKIEPDENDDDLPRVIREYPFIHIKEKGVTNWISQHQISSGMFRTLMHISEISLSDKDTVILIDEFENSLGVNCIDVLTDLLLENRNIQFIITSHHPYIINNIKMEHWKIVTRQAGVVIAWNAQDFNLGKSRHQAFMQLINLDVYKEGIKVG